MECFIDLEGLQFKKRAVELADTLLELRDPEALIIIGLGQERLGESTESQRNLLRAISANPDPQQARYALLRSWFPRIAQDPNDLPQRIKQELQALSGTSAVVMRAWLAASKRDLQELAQLDSALASVLPTDLWYLDAVKLRADWRINMKGSEYQPQLAREATRLIDNAIALYQDTDFYSMRLASSFVADDVMEVVETARRLVFIYEGDVARTEAGEINPTARAIALKLRQLEAAREILKTLRNDDRVPSYKIDNLEAVTARVTERLKSLPAFSQR